jgi:Holliday junction resolvasome RuvABC endonuclease subunit
VTPPVLGVDPSLTATGLALPDGSLTLAGGAAALGDRRLRAIYDVVVTEATLQRAQLAVIEDLPTHAHGAGITGMVQGVVRLALLQARVPYALVPAATLKKYATGDGGAGKPDMRMALYKRTGIDERDDNLVDAWFLRAAGLERLGVPAIKMPAAQVAALDKVQWPESLA